MKRRSSKGSNYLRYSFKRYIRRQKVSRTDRSSKEGMVELESIESIETIEEKSSKDKSKEDKNKNKISMLLSPDTFEREKVNIHKISEEETTEDSSKISKITDEEGNDYHQSEMNKDNENIEVDLASHTTQSLSDFPSFSVIRDKRGMNDEVSFDSDISRLMRNSRSNRANLSKVKIVGERERWSSSSSEYESSDEENTENSDSKFGDSDHMMYSIDLERNGATSNGNSLGQDEENGP
jgi:hypothetical protein